MSAKKTYKSKEIDMKNVKGYKFVIDENYTKESYVDYIKWAEHRLIEIESLLSTSFGATFSPEYKERLIKEHDYLMEKVDSAFESELAIKYNF